MSDNPRGEPVRSRDLTRRFQESAQRVIRAEETVNEIQSAIRQTQLALQAHRGQKPKGRASSAEHGVTYVDVQPGPGAGRIGPFLTARRLDSQNVFYDTPQGTGSINLLREGEIWARTSDTAEATFEARLQPARLMRYNELLVPYIAGKRVELRFHHDQGSTRYGPFTESVLIRRPQGQRFNGRVEVTSKSQSKIGGDYVHALGGLEIRESDWTASWDLSATFEAPKDGTIELKEMIAHPGGQVFSFDVEDESGNSLTKTESVSEGDQLVLKASGLDPTTTASLAKIKYDYI